MTPCKPSTPLRECIRCLRYRPDLPELAESRPRTVVVDATVVRRPGTSCPMKVIPVVRL